MWRRAADTSRFILHSARAPRLIGSILPSSAALAEAVAKGLVQGPPGRRVLEIGAGIGAITRYIVRRLHAGDRLDVIDRNPSFCDILGRRFHGAPGVRVICASLLDWKASDVYDAILIGLPLNNFDVALAEAVLVMSRALLRPGGRVCYFEYLHVPACLALSRRMFGRKPRGHFARIDEAKQRFRASFAHVEERTVLRNFPPARVVTCWND